jgi:hypothetical protein
VPVGSGDELPVTVAESVSELPSRIDEVVGLFVSAEGTFTVIGVLDSAVPRLVPRAVW